MKSAELFAFKEVKVYYLINALRALAISFIFAVSINFMLAHGLTQFQANLNNAVFFLSLFLFEIPTGIVADTFGRKVSVLLGLLICGLGALGYYFSPAFIPYLGVLPTFMLCEMIFAFGITFHTGAFDAWLVDSLHLNKVREVPSYVFAHSQTASQLSTIVGAIIGSRLFPQFHYLPWFLTGATFLLTGTLTLYLMQEKYFVRKSHTLKDGWKHMKAIAKTSFNFGRNHRIFRYLMILGMIQFMFVMPANMFWQPWFDKVVGQANLGYVWAGMMLFVAVGGYMARHSKISESEEGLVLMLCQVGVGLGFMFWALPGTTAISLLPFLLHEIGRGLYLPVKTAYLNHHLPKDERATLLSFDGQANDIGGFLGLILSGLLASLVGLGFTLAVFGFCMAACSVLLYKKFKP
ncbi:MAG TPA: MFS transporter [Patescibacteria group bacterium]|nr:MFS transporter [Patescibacteria group bacterium]